MAYLILQQANVKLVYLPQQIQVRREMREVFEMFQKKNRHMFINPLPQPLFMRKLGRKSKLKATLTLLLISTLWRPLINDMVVI